MGGEVGDRRGRAGTGGEGKGEQIDRKTVDK